VKIQNKNNNLAIVGEKPTVTREGWTESSADWNPPPTAATQTERTNPIALHAESIHHQFGSHQVLSDLCITLYCGDTLGLLGLNGAGKTTLLTILAGVIAPDQGTVHVGEHELYRDSIAARMQIGYAPDTPAVYPEYRVIEFLRFIAEARRIPRAQIKASIDNVLQRCRLGEVRQRVIGNLSSGYQQRVNLAQALIHHPKVLILDEPTNGLDPQQMLQMRELVGELESDQATIFSSHQLTEIQSVCNRVLVIERGKRLLDAYLTHLSGSSLLVKLETPFDLNNLPGISTACELDNHQWIVTGQALNANLIKTMLESRGVTAHQIEPAHNFLESLIQRMTPNSQQTNGCNNDS